MKKIMKSVLAIVGILALASCSSAEDLFTENLGDNNKSVKMTFTASQENGSATRTAIGTEGVKTKIHWSEDDIIKVTNGIETNDFTLKDGAGTTNATFEGNMPVSEDYYAIYPNQSGVTFSNNTFSGVQLKATQEAVEGSFDPTAAIMVAKSNGTNFPFKNVVAYFKVTPYIDCSEIVVTAHKSTDALAGTFEVNMSIGEDGTLTPTIGTITDKKREVKLTGTIEKDKDYYILLLPGTFDYGFSVTLKPNNVTSKKYFKQRNTSYTLNRNDLCDLGTMADATLVGFNDDTTIPYITFKADVEQTFSYYNYRTQMNMEANQCLEYSVGDGEWKNFNNESSVNFGGSGRNLRLRAKERNGIFRPDQVDEDGENYYSIMFKFGDPNVPVKCEGDVRTLIDYENYYCANTSKATFEGFFSNMTNLESAPNLPNMELANNCYKQMFYGCTGLTTAPALPATTLADNCYYQMFQGCSKLSNVTMLATTYSAAWCLTNWLTNAGTSAGRRKLTLASEDVYNGIKGNGASWLPTQWQQGTNGATVSW